MLSMTKIFNSPNNPVGETVITFFLQMRKRDRELSTFPKADTGNEFEEQDLNQAV